jgi:hypothetical protein
MHLLSFLTRLHFLGVPTQHSVLPTQANSLNQSIFSLTRHTQLSPSPSVPDPSTTMLATMPCTPFPLRTNHYSPSAFTLHQSMSVMEEFGGRARGVLRRRPEKRVAVSTYDFKALGREVMKEWEWVEIVFVEWFFVCVYCWAEMDANGRI